MTTPHPSTSAFPLASDRGIRKISAFLQTRTALLSSLCFLVVASLVLVGSQAALVKQRGLASQMQTAWQAARQIELAKANEARRLEAIDTLMKEAEKTGLVASAWDERRFSIRQSSMARKAANRLLGEIVRSRGHIFAAEQFELSVKDPQDGLFTLPLSSESELVVSLRGSLLYRAKATSR